MNGFCPFCDEDFKYDPDRGEAECPYCRGVMRVEMYYELVPKEDEAAGAGGE